MPSANPKLEKQVSTEAVEPIRQALIVIEHRIRNLEKRKGKLESYRNIQKNGGELNADQKTAVEKFEEVQQSLEITRDMYKQIVSIANDAAKQQKKLARKEALERMQQDISKVREVLVIQETFSSLSDKKIREDFLSGVNGAVRLTEEEIKYLEDINHETLIKPQFQDNLTLLQQAQKVAEHYIAILDGKQREIVGTTYSKIKEIVYTIIKSGYFDKIQAETQISVHEVKDAIDEVCVNELPVSKENKETYCRSDSHIPPSESLLPMPNFSAPLSPNSGASVPVSVVQDHVSTQQSVTSSNVSSVENFYSNKSAYVSQPQTQQQQSILQSSHSLPHAPRINDVIGTPNFFFLQESELDAPEVTTQSAISHISTTVNAPIPSQTFTNQSFVSAAVVPQQVIFQHQSQHELSHLTGFNSSNPPPPIPMPPSHQNNIQFNSQHSGFQQQQCQNHTYEQLSHQESVNQLINENKLENLHEVCNSEGSINQTMDSNEWGQVTEPGSNDWGPSDSSLSNIQDTMIQNQNPQQAWGDQSRSNYRNRGGRRGNSNSFNNRSRGGYQSNNRGTFYRGDSSYPNGYQRNWNSTDNSGFNSGFKRNGNSRGAPRGGTDRGNRSQFRGNHRSLSRANYVTRNKIQAQN